MPTQIVFDGPQVRRLPFAAPTAHRIIVDKQRSAVAECVPPWTTINTRPGYRTCRASSVSTLCTSVRPKHAHAGRRIVSSRNLCGLASSGNRQAAFA